jgi:hypothetical protein
MNTVKAYVTKSDGDFVRVKILGAEIKEKLVAIGFVNDIDLNEYRLSTPSDEKKAEVFNRLRNMDVYFSDGREWCPSEVFEYLRDAGLLSGKFTMISWSAPGKFFITADK